MQNTKYNIGVNVVYLAHGVGEIVAIESQTLYGIETQYYKISFPQDNMTISLPINKAEERGLRPVVAKSAIEKLWQVLGDGASRGRKSWNKKKQEQMMEKLKSGDLFQTAQVVQDLHSKSNQDRSYTERNLYEGAIKKLAEEIAIVEGTSTELITSKIVDILQQGGSI